MVHVPANVYQACFQFSVLVDQERAHPFRLYPDLINKQCKFELCKLQIINLYIINYTEPRAQNNGRSTDNVRPECGVVRSNSYLAGDFVRSFVKGVLAFEKGILPFEKGVLPFEKGVLPFEKGVLPFQN